MYYSFPAVEIADLELAAPEFWIVADAGQQFVDRCHRADSRSWSRLGGRKSHGSQPWGT